MKKLLLGTSAIALAGAFVTQASAAEWEVRVGGYMEQHVAYSSTDSNVDKGEYDGIDPKSDAEVHFSPSITLDNGLKFSAQIELEGATSGDQIDENYLNITGSFGQIRIGEDDNAAYNLSYGAPDVTFVNINSGSDTAFWGGKLLTTFTTTHPAVTGDPVGIAYYSPRMAGFQVGASYHRDANRATNDAQIDIDGKDTMSDIWGVGANFVQSFGDFNIAASAGYTTGDLNGHKASAGQFLSSNDFHIVEEYWCSADDSFAVDSTTGDITGRLRDTDPTSPTFGDIIGQGSDGINDGAIPSDLSFPPGPVGPDGWTSAAIERYKVVTKNAVCAASDRDPEAYSFALNVGYAGFTIGGSYMKEDETSKDAEVWDLGVSYETGPWGFSFTYLDYEDKFNTDIEKYMIGMSYALAQGVKLNAYGIYAEASGTSSSPVWEDSTFPTPMGPASYKTTSIDEDGFIIGTGVKVNF